MNELLFQVQPDEVKAGHKPPKVSTRKSIMNDVADQSGPEKQVVAERLFSQK